MANPLLLNVAELLRRPGAERHVALTASLAHLDIVDDRFDADADADVALRLESLSDGIVVDGTLSIPWHGVCRRCLGPAAGVVVSDVHELYQHTITDPDAFEIVGDQLDLRPMVREVILLDTPVTPLCRPDCAGLCPTCGIDRNDATCACEPAAADPRWAALDQLGQLATSDE